MLRTLRVAFVALAVLVVLLLGAVAAARYAPGSWAGRLFAGLATPDDGAVPQQLASLAIGGKFTLTGPGGATVTQASYPGKWRIVYFGYTTCPDVCPTTLQTIAAALRDLGPLADKVVPLFITVDPDRDTAAVMQRYTGLFDKRIIGLTGTKAQVRQAEHAYRVYAAKVPQLGTDVYLMDHTSLVYLMNPSGRLAALFDREVTPAALAARLRQALA
jgi:protein SCO1/2